MSAREHLIMAALVVFSTLGAAVLAQSIFTPDLAGCDRATPRATMGALEACGAPVGVIRLRVE